MIVSNEPGYYRGGAYGIRIENLQVVTPGRCRPAATASSTASRPSPWHRSTGAACRPNLLDAAERVWLDAYHARVRAELLEPVEPEARQWLIAATAPL